jgi:signal transduction histidine kinase
MRFLRSMRFQTSAIIFVSFMLSHITGYLFYKYDRQNALEMTEAFDIAERAAGVSRLLRDLPDDWRQGVLEFSDSRAFRVWKSTVPAVEMPAPTVEESELLNYLRSQVPRVANHEMRVRFAGANGYSIKAPPLEKSRTVGALQKLPEVPEGSSSVAISIQHSSGNWINFVGVVNTPKSLLPELFLTNFTSAVLGVGLVAFWLVGRVITPLEKLSEAAEGLGKDISRPPLETNGPLEVAAASIAFNKMQSRLARLIKGRTDLLAAISHDLRTPLTQIRLRLELAPETVEREKNLRTLDEMDAILGTFLTYARAAHESEGRTRIDIGTLVSSICDDLIDFGSPVECKDFPTIIVPCKRLAVKRATVNLIDNALKYGNQAIVSVTRTNGGAIIAIEDSGPGIPNEELTLVLQPFFRGGRSSHLQTPHGSGLGLAIAQAIAEDHGGELRLSNLESGGLRAEILLPICM